jgi:hypothetical protein
MTFISLWTDSRLPPLADRLPIFVGAALLVLAGLVVLVLLKKDADRRDKV